MLFKRIAGINCIPTCAGKHKCLADYCISTYVFLSASKNQEIEFIKIIFWLIMWPDFFSVNLNR